MKKFILATLLTIPLLIGCEPFTVGIDTTQNMVYESPSMLKIQNGMFNAGVAMHTWENGVGVIGFNGVITKVKTKAFYNNRNLENIILPSSVEYIEDYAFYGCVLTSVNLGNVLKQIKYCAFNGCNKLTTIIIPESIELIGDYAFYGCNKLKTVYCKATTPPIAGDNILPQTYNGLVIYVPKSSVNLYKKASGWASYKDNIVGM